MARYKVVYDLFEMQGSAMVRDSRLIDLQTEVEANNPSIAQAIVEAQFGGSNRVWVKRVGPA